MKRFAFVFLAAVFLMAQVMPVVAAERYSPSYNHRGNIGDSGRIWQYGYFDKLIGDGTNASLYGFKHYVVSKTTSYSLTAADCGKVFNNQGASAAIQFDLPALAASGLQGCTYTFVVGTAKSIKVNPSSASSDIIPGLTGHVGDAIGCATVGGAITLMATSASEWTNVGNYQTWGDEG
jgi:hypothetical protein